MKTCKIFIKPLSVNQCWQGRRFKTKAYKQYEKDVLSLLKPHQIKSGRLSLKIYFGLSNTLNDIDNSVKPFLDILQKKYGFNDKDIYELHVYKLLVKKGCEYIEFEISEIK